MSSDRVFTPGERLKGRWFGRDYVIERLLGEGANGKVYLARTERGRCAVKVGFDAVDLQSEINALSTLFPPEDRSPPEPDRFGSEVGRSGFFLEADDFVLPEGDVPFYAMAYVQGLPMQVFLQRRGPDWFWPIAGQLLERLVGIHRAGYAYGDLKPDHILVTADGRAELIDFGGVTAMGKAVRQFTELYDRGFWLGLPRVADEAYDLFSFAVLCMQVTDPQREWSRVAGLPRHQGAASLRKVLERCRMDAGAKSILRAIIDGKLTSSAAAIRLWRDAVPTAPQPPDLDAEAGRYLALALGGSAAAFAAALYWTLQ
jgi:Serine/threonine protein kinase